MPRPSSFYKPVDSYLSRPNYLQQHYYEAPSQSTYQPYSHQGSVQTVTVTHGNYGTSKTVSPPLRTSAVTTYPLTFTIPNPRVFTPSVRPYSFSAPFSGNFVTGLSNAALPSQSQLQSDSGPTFKLSYGKLNLFIYLSHDKT